MVTAAAYCPYCDESVLITMENISLTVCSVLTRSSYEFICSQCMSSIKKVATAEVIKLLRAGGVKETFVKIPDELLEIHKDAPINWNDVFDFAKTMSTNPDLVAESVRCLLKPRQDL